MDYYAYEEVVRDKEGKPTKVIALRVKNFGEEFEAEVTSKMTVDLNNPENNLIEGYRFVENKDVDGNVTFI